MEIKLYLPKSTDVLDKDISVSIWAIVSGRLNITPRDSLKIYSTIRNEVCNQHNYIAANRLFKLVRSTSKYIVLFNQVHTSIPGNTNYIYLAEKGGINVSPPPKTIRNKKGQHECNPQYNYQEISILYTNKKREQVDKCVIESVNNNKISRLSFRQCNVWEGLLWQVTESQQRGLIKVCKARSSLDNKVIANWLIDIVNLPKSVLLESINATSYEHIKNTLQASTASAQYFKFIDEFYSGLILGDGTDLYCFACSVEALSAISQGMSNRKSMRLMKKTDQFYILDNHQFTMISSTTKCLSQELKLASRQATNY